MWGRNYDLKRDLTSKWSDRKTDSSVYCFRREARAVPGGSPGVVLGGGRLPHLYRAGSGVHGRRTDGRRRRQYIISRTRTSDINTTNT